MVPLVANYIKPMVTAQGGRYEIRSTSSSSTETWANGDELERALAEYDPELVLISLGSNELFVTDFEARRAFIRKLTSAIGGRSCLWIGPPAWAKGAGFLDVLQESVAPCRYFDAAGLRMERQADGRHPTWGASYRWATQVWKALGGTGEPPKH